MTGLYVFDNRAQVPDPIAAMVGRRRFGAIRRRRQSLLEEAARLVAADGAWRFVPIHSDEGWHRLLAELSEIPTVQPLILHRADLGIADAAGLADLMQRAVHAPQPLPGSPWPERFFVLPDARDLPRSLTPAEPPGPALAIGPFLQDLTDPGQFLLFIAGATEARFFNSLTGAGQSLTKASSDRDKIRREYRYWRLLPESLQPWFVQPVEFQDDGSRAQYRMERLLVPDLAVSWIHHALSPAEFARCLQRILEFFDSRPQRPVTPERGRALRLDLYQTKLRQRFDRLRTHPDFPRIDGLIRQGTRWAGLLPMIETFLQLAERHLPQTDREAIIHGDPCFSNMLYDKRTALLRFIDPKGADQEPELWSDPLYDLAKLSHSVLGDYDFINNDMFRLSLDRELKLSLEIQSVDLTAHKQVFLQMLEARGEDIRQMRIAEASLFLSMLPLHADHPAKVLAFCLRAVDIIEEVLAQV